MSPAPSSPAPSKLPESNLPLRQGGGTVSQQTTSDVSSSSYSLPEPLIRLELRDLRHDSSKVFLSNFDAAVDVADLIRTVLQLLYLPTTRTSTSSSGVSSMRPNPFKPHIPGTRSITLIIRDIEGVAYTTGLDLDSEHKEIHFSLSYIAHVQKSSADKAAIRKELMGVVCHELVHCWQHNARGTAPGGLIEGIADWVRLRAGYVPPHWKREAGDDWDAGYQKTGYFLDWIENKHGEGSVRRINEALRDTEYVQRKFWKDLFGKTVDDLWYDYCDSLDEKK
ncbi:hypothetical protein ANO11243_025070 [Dothideomycetidae sp. 11243]|nr:hypothetical protein ANO11243_025070 [fungal sp. No.11243]